MSTWPAEVRSVDYHTGGESFRIVTDVPPLSGATVAERRVAAIGDPAVDGLRALLCSEPRGHADMYGGFVVPPDDDGAHLGVLFWHKDGFSTACGHGTIALGAWAIHTGLVTEDPAGVTDVVVDVPSGRVTARVHSSRGRVSHVDFVNVASHVLHRAVRVRGLVADIASGGAIYAHVDLAPTGLHVVPADLTALVALAREIKAELAGSPWEQHPGDERLSGTYGVIFFEDQGTDERGNPRQRNVTVFADGEVDRSPCGSGTASRVAVLAADEVLTPELTLRHESIVGSVFAATYTDGPSLADGTPTVLPVVTGAAYRTGEHRFVVDPDDPVTPGFVLR